MPEKTKPKSKKEKNPKETKPSGPYLAVWFEIYKIGQSVKKKTNWSAKQYIREPKVWYFPVNEEPQVALDEIYTAYGKRDNCTLHMAHSFAMIHGWKRTDEFHIVEVLPIK